MNKLSNFDSFWLSTIDCCGKKSINPIVNFLTAQDLICYGISFSAFKDYFQMDDSIARKCLEKMSQGIVGFPDVLDKYLQTPSKSAARKIVSLHKNVYGIDGCLGCLDVTKIH